ncbi:Glyoxalase/bleomycin resistance protein/dioxygenase [Paenibacillus curdlanolyticus YK9]|uniref:Glyoxalase/bleomycin resistance protein/dioxygenase n=1 Tax=Paenibacillus curdlanolyticus YK9 TaxID=717606 RepID=E0I4Y1_9BACL|nr:VOC family protein [Paenibacillus curdlanolyticus]EFM12023.1 Glyoxalase/bleomycin resistance protein/dioxygenase [Paenibacillus curdlanolyticus YK9]
MSINAYLNFNGNTREVVEFYAEVFGVEVSQIHTFGESPSDPSFPLPEEAKNLVMHANLVIGGSILMFSDVFPGMPYTQGTNISLSYQSNSIEETQHVFNKLKVGGTVQMELQKTFWSECYGSLTDKFGIQWQVNYNAL